MDLILLCIGITPKSAKTDPLKWTKLDKPDTQETPPNAPNHPEQHADTTPHNNDRHHTGNTPHPERAHTPDAAATDQRPQQRHAEP